MSQKRRSHPLRVLVLAVVLAVSGAACERAATKASSDAASTSSMSSPMAAASSMPAAAGTDMGAMDEAGVKAYPAKTKGLGAQDLKPVIVNGVKVFTLTVSAIKWEVSQGTFLDAYAYNGQIPGPTLRAFKGDKVRIVVHNQLPESTTVHFHGLTVPNSMDGVPFITQPPIRPGQTFTYSFPIKDNPGTYMYHSHANALAQVGKGLFGTFIVDPGKRAWDVESIVYLGDSDLGFTLNAKSFPATAPIVAPLGKRVLLRFLNAGNMLHPMHLHGYHFTVLARDGYPTPPYQADTLVVAPGERFDAIFTADNPGVWAFHCHILQHAEGPNGMFGMVTAVIVK